MSQPATPSSSPLGSDQTDLDQALERRFGSGLRCAVIGASGGIGGALINQLASFECVDVVFGLARNGLARPEPLPEKLKHVRIDYDHPETIAAGAELCAIDGALDLVIVATGLLHDGANLNPEKDWRHLDAQSMARIFHVNTIGPSLVAKAFLPILTRERTTVFAILGARVGSISDNRLGGWYAYRASKAALAMVVVNLAIELKRKRRSTIAVALHPGTVDSGLSKPFQSGTRPGQVVTPTLAAAHLLTVIGGLSPNDSGGHFAWDGTRIPA